MLRLMKIEYDPVKVAQHPLNHDGVTFDEASAVLLDPFALTRKDQDAPLEPRFITLGFGPKGGILVVVWPLRNGNVRLISA